MAIVIKSIPVLRDSSAKKFIKKAENALKTTSTVDFSEQIKSANNILAKAKKK